MGLPAGALQSCAISVNTFDGSRQPLSPAINVLITLRDGHQRQVYRAYSKGPGVILEGLQYFNNFGDNYTVVAWAKGHRQAGFTPVKVAPNATSVVDLMLLAKNAGFNFAQARWGTLKRNQPRWVELLSTGVKNETVARARYTQLMEDRPAVLACFFNLATALSQIHLPSGGPLDYFRELIWDDGLQPDRFFAYADRALVDQVRRATDQGEFAPEPGSAAFHPGATSSFKQVQFGEANVQLTFHEDDAKTIDGVDCIKVELDIDYYKDLGAHALLEVLANKLAGSLTDPRQVYVLRWIAGRRAGVPEFDPPYTIA